MDATHAPAQHSTGRSVLSIALIVIAGVMALYAALVLGMALMAYYGG